MKMLCAALGLTILLASAPAALAQDLPRPGKEHAFLAERVGDWKLDMSFREPGGPWMKMSGTEKVEMTLGGFWQKATLNATMEMGPMKIPFTGIGTLGYDPTKKKYVGTWLDSMSPWLATMEGDYDPKTKTLSMMSTHVDPTTGKREPMIVETVFKSADEATFRMIHPKKDDGKDWVSAKIEYKRVKVADDRAKKN